MPNGQTIEKFIAEEYWSLQADITADGSDPFKARLVTLDGEKLTKFSLGNEDAAARARAAVEAASFRIANVESKPTRRNPSAPFTTSTTFRRSSPGPSDILFSPL